MASETNIKTEIQRLVGTCSLWTIGLTDNPDLREFEMGNPQGWRNFTADTETVAKNVEAHFVGKGMDGDAGSRTGRAKCVYIFMSLQDRLEGSRSIQQENSWKFLR